MTDRPVITIVKEALAEVLKLNEDISTFTSGNIFINRYDPFELRECKSIGVFVLSEERIDSDLCRDPDMRKISVQVEILGPEDMKEDPYGETLDHMADLVDRIYFGAGILGYLGEVVKAEGYKDDFKAIDWEATDSGYIVDNEVILSVRILGFSIEYEKRPKPIQLPDFKQAATDFKAKTKDGSVMEASDFVTLQE
jgi:hypothetical protein